MLITPLVAVALSKGYYGAVPTFADILARPTGRCSSARASSSSVRFACTLAHRRYWARGIPPSGSRAFFASHSAPRQLPLWSARYEDFAHRALPRQRWVWEALTGYALRALRQELVRPSPVTRQSGAGVDNRAGALCVQTLVFSAAGAFERRGSLEGRFVFARHRHPAPAAHQATIRRTASARPIGRSSAPCSSCGRPAPARARSGRPDPWFAGPWFEAKARDGARVQRIFRINRAVPIRISNRSDG